MLNRLFSLLTAQSNMSIEQFANASNIEKERLTEIIQCDTVDSRVIEFREILGVSRASGIRFRDAIQLNQSVRGQSPIVCHDDNKPTIITKILSHYRDANDERLNNTSPAEEHPLKSFLAMLPHNHDLSCNTPQILYLDDSRYPSDTMSINDISGASVLLVKTLNGFYKTLRAGFIPDAVHFDGFLADGERGISAVEMLARDIVDGELPLAISVYFHSADESENKKMKNLFFSTLNSAGLSHHQSLPSVDAQTKNKTHDKSKSALRDQIARQKNKGRR